jgi:copper chaperone CopZ
VSRALKGLSGVTDVQVDLGKAQAVVSHQGADLAAMKAAVDDAGYDVVGVA